MDKFVKCISCEDIHVVQRLGFLAIDVGFTLRKDDPAALKDVILQIQNKAANTDTQLVYRTVCIIDYDIIFRPTLNQSYHMRP